ncbi:MAG: butyrate kinase [Firmicutes bacterium]|nr:butyrate kinase [Bacillota bacterium]
MLVLNPGSTSTKLALFDNDQVLLTENLSHPPDELEGCGSVVNQYSLRKKAVLEFLAKKNTALSALAAVVARGGLTKPLTGGTYKINERMLADLKSAKWGDHASNLGPILAYELAQEAGGIPAFTVDPVVVDELDDLARISGLPQLPRRSKFHALNQKAAARRAAKALACSYQELNLIVAHMGGGISIGAHKQGRVVDVNNALDGDGPMSPERSGTLPAGDLIRLCYSGRFTFQEMMRMVNGRGGLMAHLGTTNTKEIQQRVQAGDKKAELVFKALAYQVAKSICALVAILGNKPDAIVLTGGMAHSEMLTGWIKERVGFLAPVLVYPGEGEMEALAQGALRILNQKETPQVYT